MFFCLRETIKKGNVKFSKESQLLKNESGYWKTANKNLQLTSEIENKVVINF